MKVLVFFSGGKDSQASLIWAVKEYGLKYVEAVFCDTGWEHPLTLDHIKSVTDQMGVKLVTLRSKKYDGFIDLAKKKKRFPSTNARFCTEELKSKPTIDYVLEQQEHLIVVEGIRKNESISRSKMDKQCTYFKFYFEPYITNSMIVEMYSQMPKLNAIQLKKLRKAKDRLGIGKEDAKFYTYRKKDVLNWCNEYNADKVRPVFEWTAEEVINDIRDNIQTPNHLYYQGFSRVGCFPCIMWRHREVKLIIDNFPEKWESLKNIEKEIGHTFFPPSFIPQKFHTGRTENGKSYCTAEDVEKYLTGEDATLDIFEEETPSCMSVYGLCE